VQPERYDSLLENKVEAVHQLLQPFAPPAPSVFPSRPEGFRMRAEFRVWHEGQELNYVMFRKDDPKTPIAISEFPIATEGIQALMPVLLAALKRDGALRRKLFQVEFLASLSGEMVVTLVYHRALDDDWEAAAGNLVEQLKLTCPTLSLVGRSRGQKVVIGNDYVREVLKIHGREFAFRQYEQAFTQPNGELNIRMIEWACEQSASLGGDLLELYCGNGNFTLPLSRHFDRVLATEVSKASIRAARANAGENGIDNVELVRMSAEEVTDALRGERVFRRLARLQTPLAEYRFATLFVDPPRAGLDARTVKLGAGFTHILYVSCNPHTLADNLGTLCESHRIERFALFDQFPYTDHIECGVLLRKV
jgi:tRNA (uracil-5-)-methyltransferase